MNRLPEPPHSPGSPSSSPESTATLLGLVRGGDTAAKNRLLERYLPVLTRWAEGRLPARARGAADTDDLVQVTLVRALSRLDTFEPRHEGAFLAYLRRILMNQIRDLVRRGERRPGAEGVTDGLVDPGRSPLEDAIGSDTLERYERALASLPETQREAVILRLEFGFTHQQVAEAIGSPSWNAARMTVARALIQIAEAMDESR